SRVVPLVVADAQAQAKRLLADALAETEQRREHLRAELEAEARANAQAELAQAHIALADARVRVLRDAEASIAELAPAVARRIIADELDVHPERVRALVCEAIDRVRRASEVRVRVHPEDASQLSDLDVPVPVEIVE